MIPGSANPLLLAGAAEAAGYNVERSVRFNNSDSAYLSRTPASAGNRKTWTWAGWVKRCRPGNIDHIFNGVGSGSPTYTLLYFFSGDTLDFDGGGAGSFSTTQVFRDFSAWYHIVLAFDTTQATSSNRIRLWVNGQQVTAFNSISYPTQNADGGLNQAGLHKIGNWTSEYSNFYLADIHFIDGQALDPTSFGEFDTNGIWQPVEYAGTYGTNGFHLPFSDNSTAAALGTDTSGNGNTWTVNNISVTAGAGNDSLVDTPSSTGTDTGAGGEVRGNYCTWNPLDKGANIVLTNGNLDSTSSINTWFTCRGSAGVLAGKWYWEVTLNAAVGGGNAVMIGIAKNSASLSDFFSSSDTAGYYSNNGNKYPGPSSYGSSFGLNDVIGVALDLDAGTLTFYKNGVSQGQSHSGLSGTWFPAISHYLALSVSANFGQRPFAYTAPSGFKALCDTNLPAPVVAKPSEVMDVKLYTGNGSTQTISGLGFSPDLVWIKKRSGAEGHLLSDTVRGIDNGLYSNQTVVENNFLQYGKVSAVSGTGFTVAATTDTPLIVNQSSSTYVAWCWDAGSSTVTNTQGSITSQVRANPSAGFSIVSYTSTGSTATVGHGLGVAPSMVITKCRSIISGFVVQHISLANNNVLYLNGTDSSQDVSGNGSLPKPTSTVFSVNNQQGSNGVSGTTMIAYCFAPVAGYSAFGSYTGNGNADGPFVFTGMRPRWILVKASSSVTYGSWRLHDTSRDPYNVCGNQLSPNLPDKEYGPGTVGPVMDILSNGFKLRSGFDGWNGSSATYIYAAFAESPFQFSRAR